MNGNVWVFKCRESKIVDTRHILSVLLLKVCNRPSDDLVSIVSDHKQRLLAHFCEDPIKIEVYMNAVNGAHKALKTVVYSCTVWAGSTRCSCRKEIQFSMGSGGWCVF